MTMSLSESLKQQDIGKEADAYAKKYKPFMEDLQNSSILKKVRPITEADIYALGHQLHMFENYKQFCEDSGQLAQLGTIPNIALDVITAAYGTSPVAAIASVQPIEEERGTVYYKALVAQTTRGNATAGQRIATPLAMEDVAIRGYATDRLTQAGGNTADMDTSYTVTCGSAPVKPGSIAVQIVGITLKTYDDGQGNLLGVGIQGTINYDTGVVDFTLDANPGAGKAITVTYVTDFAAGEDLPQVQFKLETKSVQARVFALKSTMGLEMSYALNRRFGLIAEDEIANDLVSAINGETANTLIAELAATAVGNTTWDKTAPNGVSYFEHKQSFKDAVATANATMVGNAGRGTINVMVAGRAACAVIQTLPGFNLVATGADIGPHIFGTLDGTLVIRVPNSATLDANTILCLYKGPTQFDSAAVYCPFMPLVVTSTLPTGTNPLLQQRAAAVWAAIENLVPNLVTKITITAS